MLQNGIRTRRTMAQDAKDEKKNPGKRQREIEEATRKREIERKAKEAKKL